MEERITDKYSKLSAQELIKVIQDAEQRALEAEEDTIKAACYGQQLLSKLETISVQLEERNQQIFFLENKIELKGDIEKQYEDDIEILNEKHKDGLSQLERLKSLQREHDQTLEQLRIKDSIMTSVQEENDVLRKQLTEMKEFNNEVVREATAAAVNNSSLNESVRHDSTLQAEHLAILEEKHALQCQNLELKGEVEKLKGEVLRMKTSFDEQRDEMFQNHQLELMTYFDTVASLRVKLEADKEADEDICGEEQIVQAPLRQGNSLFSEVDDRRKDMEHELDVCREELNSTSHELKKSREELKKSKYHTMKLLEMQSEQREMFEVEVERLQDMLESEKRKGLMLRNHQQFVTGHAGQTSLQTKHSTRSLTSLKSSNMLSNIIKPPHDKENENKRHSNGKNCVNNEVQQPFNSNFQLSQMLKQLRTENSDLKVQVNNLMQVNLRESEKSCNLSRNLLTSERRITQLNLDMYKLNMKYDENFEIPSNLSTVDLFENSSHDQKPLDVVNTLERVESVANPSSVKNQQRDSSKNTNTISMSKKCDALTKEEKSRDARKKLNAAAPNDKAALTRDIADAREKIQRMQQCVQQ